MSNSEIPQGKRRWLQYRADTRQVHPVWEWNAAPLPHKHATCKRYSYLLLKFESTKRHNARNCIVSTQIANSIDVVGTNRNFYDNDDGLFLSFFRSPPVQGPGRISNVLLSHDRDAKSDHQRSSCFHCSDRFSTNGYRLLLLLLELKIRKRCFLFSLHINAMRL